MVFNLIGWLASHLTFQYSLCRVVLMVPRRLLERVQDVEAFSTRSVESF